MTMTKKDDNSYGKLRYCQYCGNEYDLILLVSDLRQKQQTINEICLACVYKIGKRQYEEYREELRDYVGSGLA